MRRSKIRTKHQQVAALEAELLKRCRCQHGRSRVDLARSLKLAPSTAGIYVDRLIREGYLLEGEAVDRKAGRRPTLVAPNPAAGHFVGVDFEANSLMTTVLDFSLQVVSRAQRTLTPGESVEQILHRIEDSITAAVRYDECPLLGIGIGVPGLIDVRRGLARHYNFIPGWTDVPIVPRLARKFAVPVHMEHNIRSMAMAELWLGHGRGLGNFVCFGVRTGIGAGIVTHGELVTGARDAAGEIGGWPVAALPAGSALDRGGRTLEEVASLRAILAAVSRTTGYTCDFARLRLAIDSGDLAVLAVLEHAAAIHGAALRNLLLLLDPERIVLTGPLAELGAAYLAPLTAAIGLRVDGAAPSVLASNFGQYGGAVGAAALALHRWIPQR